MKEGSDPQMETHARANVSKEEKLPPTRIRSDWFRSTNKGEIT